MTKDILYPPFETKAESPECPNMLLSFELKRSFETVNHIHRSQKVLMTNDASDNVRTNKNERVVDKDQRDLDARKFEAAVAAAVAAETEISTLKRGIMELENLLYQEESSEGNVIVNVDKFPILPSAIEDDNN